MSHNVTMQGIPLKDMTVLGLALQELNKDFGADFELRVGNQQASRNYGRSSVLRNTHAVIHSKKLNYDITITRDPKSGKLDVQAEAMLIGPLMHLLRVPPKVTDVSTGETMNVGATGYRNNEALGMKAALGPITQRYAVLIAERQAAMKGHAVRRQHNKETGVITLVASVR